MAGPMTAQLMILSTAAVVSVSDSMRWGVVLDCGSSGTRVHLYNWDHDVGLESLAEFTPTRKEDQDLLIDNIKGISSFADVPAGVAPYITSYSIRLPAGSPPQSNLPLAYMHMPQLVCAF